MAGRRSGSSGAWWLGVDVGATKILAGAVRMPSGRVTASKVRRLRKTDVTSVLEMIEGLSRELSASRGPGLWRGVGVAIAAQVRARDGTVLHAPNLRWRNVPFAPKLASRLGAPVFLENDVRAAMVGERWKGRAAGVANAVALVLGTGVGGAVVADGRLLHGARGAAGELGHLTVVSEGRRCTCGHRGCLEAYVGGWAIARRARELARTSPRAGAPMRRRAGSLSRIEAATVFELASARDPLARRLLGEAFGHLVAGAVGVTNLVNPSLILLGGGIADHWPGLPRRLESELRARCQPPAAAPVRVRRMALGPIAPVLGAVRIATGRDR